MKNQNEMRACHSTLKQRNELHLHALTQAGD